LRGCPSLLAIGMLVLLVLAAPTVAAQPSSDYIKITPPSGMRWKTLDQSAVTQDILFVDKDGNTWLRKSAATTFAASFVLVQLVGDTGGTDQWMELVENLPHFLGLRPDPDWSNYRAFTSFAEWRRLIAEQHVEAMRDALSAGGLMAPWIVLPIYRSASDPSWLWWSPEQGPLMPDAVLTGQFKLAARVKAGTDVPYTVTVLDLLTDPPSEITRPGGYELYRNYYPRFNEDGSLTLTLAGDFSFQKDYLLPEGPACGDGLPRLPDGTCAGGSTTFPVPAEGPGAIPIGNEPPGGAIPAGPSGAVGSEQPGGSTAGGPPLVAPEPTAQAAAPLAPPALAPNVCTAIAGAVLDLCGEARSRASAVAPTVLLPPIALNVNPVRGIVHVPDWYWASGYDGRPRTATRTYSLPWSRQGTPIRDPETGEVIGETPGSSGTYTLTITVRYRPGRYRWDFGDGAILDTGSLGRPYPTASDVQHAYQWSSVDQPKGSYTYGLFIDWVGDWQVSGDATGSGTLEPRQSSYQAQQEMRDLQQVLCPDTGCAR
jgi:hypothetical protein